MERTESFKLQRPQRVRKESAKSPIQGYVVIRSADAQVIRVKSDKPRRSPSS